MFFETSEAKLRVSVPSSSSKNYAFPALCPTWKTETVGTSVFRNCIYYLAVYLVYSGRHLHLWDLVSIILSKLQGFFFPWVLSAGQGCEVGPVRLEVVSPWNPSASAASHPRVGLSLNRKRKRRESEMRLGGVGLIEVGAPKAASCSSFLGSKTALSHPSPSLSCLEGHWY